MYVCVHFTDSHEEDFFFSAVHVFLPLKHFSSADHIDVLSANAHTTVTASNEVPVSVVDMDVPVTAIDEVLDDFASKITKKKTKLLPETESAGSKGMSKDICFDIDIESFMYIFFKLTLIFFFLLQVQIFLTSQVSSRGTKIITPVQLPKVIKTAVQMFHSCLRLTSQENH